MGELQRFTQDAAAHAVSLQLQETEDALHALGFRAEDFPCECKRATILTNDEGATIPPEDRPVYLMPCERHRRLLLLPERVQIAWSRRHYVDAVGFPPLDPQAIKSARQNHF